MTSRCILFADDDVLTQWIMAEVMTEAGFTVVSACRGIEAVRLLDDAEYFDLMITDLDLPDTVSATELGRHWRVARPGRPVIYTGASRHPVAQRLEHHESFLHKPFTPDMLLQAIEFALDEAAFHSVLPAFCRDSSHVH